LFVSLASRYGTGLAVKSLKNDAIPICCMMLCGTLTLSKFVKTITLVFDIKCNGSTASLHEKVDAISCSTPAAHMPLAMVVAKLVINPYDLHLKEVSHPLQNTCKACKISEN
jgi:hypothetical protein